MNFDSLPDITILLKSRKSYDDKELVTTQIILKPEDYIIDGNKINKNRPNLNLLPIIIRKMFSGYLYVYYYLFKFGLFKKKNYYLK